MRTVFFYRFLLSLSHAYDWKSALQDYLFACWLFQRVCTHRHSIYELLRQLYSLYSLTSQFYKRQDTALQKRPIWAYRKSNETDGRWLNDYSWPTTETPAKKMDYYPLIKHYTVALCKHVTLPPYAQVWVKAVTRISGLIHTNPKTFPWTG